MKKVIKQFFSGSNDVTKTFAEKYRGFKIINDGDRDLQFTIGAQTITVKPGEIFEDFFDPFDIVHVQTTSSYRAYVYGLISRPSQSLVTDSSTNGNILIDENEIQIYDDSELKTNLSQLQSNSHTHANQTTLDKLSDNGTNLLLNGTPISHASNLASLSDVDLSTTEPINGDVLTYRDGTWGPKAYSTTSSSNTTYLIELGRWGITQGLPAKPYIDAHYQMADNNIKGLNNAIQYAYNNGYSEIVLPRGEYAVCYPRPINLASGITLNLNGSILKVIYDSDRQSPFDTANRSTSKDYYKFGGNTIEMKGVENAHVVNGHLIGCKADRSFRVAGEVAVEWTYGVVLNNGAKFCSVRNCKIGYYMGDNLSISSSSPSNYAEFSLNLTANQVNNGNGELMPSTSTVTSGLIPLRKDTNGNNYSTIMVTGFGYSRQTALTTKETGFYFYRADGTFIGGFPRRKIYTEVTIPKDADKVRLVFYDQTNTTASSTSFQITLNYGGIPHHNIFEHNEIYYGHRGGITLGGSYNIVQDNVIRENGQGSTGFLTGNHPFNDPTRYSINQEDSYGDNCVIRNNLIQGSYHGVLIGCYSVIIEQNHFYNIDNVAINLYSLHYAVIRQNYTHNCFNNIGLMSAHLTNAHVEVTENSFHGGIVSLSSTQYQVTVTNNQFENCTNIDVGIDGIFQQNIIQYVNRDPQSVSDLGIRCPIRNCLFVSRAEQKTVRLNQYVSADEVRIENCDFENILLQTQAGKTQIVKCKFTNCKLLNHIYLGRSKAVYVDDSTLNNTLLQTGNINTPDSLAEMHIRNSMINISTLSDILRSEMNNSNITTIMTLENCHIILSTPINTLYKALSNGKVQIAIKGNRFQYTGSSSLNMTLYQNAQFIGRFVFARNRLFEINVITTSAQAQLYDPNMNTDGEPAEGYYFTGDIRTEVNQTSVGPLGWVCIAEGEACQASWTPKTDYILGSKIYNGSHVYEVMVPGTSKSTIPSLPTTGNGTTDEKSEIPVWKPSTTYQWGDLVKPTGTFDYYMECTVAGTSGSTEPAWSTWAGVKDNTVTWVPRKSIKWRRIATKAAFRPFG